MSDIKQVRKIRTLAYVPPSLLTAGVVDGANLLDKPTPSVDAYQLLADVSSAEHPLEYATTAFNRDFFKSVELSMDEKSSIASQLISMFGSTGNPMWLTVVDGTFNSELDLEDEEND